MKLLVGYTDEEVGRVNLFIARDYALLTNSMLYVVTSMTGGASEKQSDITRATQKLEHIKNIMKRSGLQCETQLSVRGLYPGEDLVRFAEENKIDHIFIGVKNKSRTQKILLGSTAQYIIIKSPCPVHTVRFDINRFTTKEFLNNRQVLVVDDEADILDSIEEILDMCIIDRASSFNEAKTLLENSAYDIAILDIMGVDGYDILQITREKDIPALMLTAHALSPENLKKSIQCGADSYLPKEEMVNLDTHIADVIKARIQGKKGYGAWFKNLKSYFDRSFGEDWREKERGFWDSFDKKYK